jgi:glycosyltransferase involved in cell wall biosynthesis
MVSMPGSSEGAALLMLYMPRPRLVYAVGRALPVYSKPYALAARLLLRKNPNDIVLNSRAMADDFSNFFCYRPRWLYPPYEETYFTPDPSAKKENLILMTGRMSTQKRFHIGILAARKLSDRGIDFRLKIVGEVKYRANEYYAYLTHLIEELHLGTKVELIPSGEKSVFRESYREALVYWNMSVGYFGTTTLEAIGCGAVPIVTPNLSEVVPETGVGYVAKDLTALVDTTEEAIRNAHETKMSGLEASKRVTESFGSKAFATRFRNLLVEAMNER